jgi:peptide subunit release factor 1 (eRF1)
MDLHERITELAQMKSPSSPVVSVYLNIRWSDEHQRERVRVFLSREIQAARAAHGPALAPDLDWIEAQAQALVAQAQVPEAEGVALFACAPLALREVLPVGEPFEDALVVSETPFVRPLAGLADEAPPALVIFVDRERARLIPVGPGGAGDEVSLAAEVPGRHSRGGWAQLAQSRYARHIQDHRARHFAAVAEALVALVEARGVERIVIAASPETAVEFREHVPARLAGRIVGRIAASWHEPAAILVERAEPVLVATERREEAGAVDAVLTEAAKSGRAVSGLEATLDAVARGAVHRLYLLTTFNVPGRRCDACGGYQSGPGPACRRCGAITRPVELGAAMAERVTATGGRAETVERHDELARVGGVAARLRYPI